MASKLTNSSVRKLLNAGVKARTGDGDGLWLDVRGVDRGQWVFRYTFHGKAREIGLGGVQAVPLLEAREAAHEIRRTIRRGVDPLEMKVTVERRDAAAVNENSEAAAAAARTFKSVAEEMLASHWAGWSNPKHRQQWRNTLATHVYPHFGAVPVAAVTTEHVLSALTPIWTATPETASRVRGRIEKVLDFAKARRWRSGENPATWRGHLKLLLPAAAKLKRVRHQPALPWRLIPVFMPALRAAGGVGASALEFAILTAARSGEVRGLVWGEIDMDRALWVIPAHRIKARREHRVPLSAPALSILERMRPMRANDSRDALVFRGSKSGRALSDMTLSAVLRRMTEEDGEPMWKDAAGAAIVPHGFRSTFRDWCAERRGESREVAEAALAHAIGDQTEAAYARSDLLERRTKLMTAWGEYTFEERGSVHQIGARV